LKELSPLAAPDPFAFRAVWGIPVRDRHGFDLLVARQLLWIPHASAIVRRILFTADEKPICPACNQEVVTGAPSIICAAILADQAAQRELQRDPRFIATRDPDALEAWWLVHGDCHDKLNRQRIRHLNERIELALRATTRVN
jgi:hypothetical protein